MKIWNHFLSFGSMIKSKKSKHVRHLIWLATTWCIWKLITLVVFIATLPNVSQYIDEVKVFSWI
jgi:hypothetical protein